MSTAKAADGVLDVVSECTGGYSRRGVQILSSYDQKG
jgi:hypothetical protein